MQRSSAPSALRSLPVAPLRPTQIIATNLRAASSIHEAGESRVDDPSGSVGARVLRTQFAFQRIERAVATTAAAAVAAATMILRSEDDVLAFDVEITGYRARQWGVLWLRRN